MRILTVRQPWAWAIIFGGKDVENRPRNLAGDYTGPVAIHAGLSMDLDAMNAPVIVNAMRTADPIGQIVVGRIIGVVDLLGVHQGTVTDGGRAQRVASCFQPGKPYGLCSRWAEHNVTHLELANPRPIRDPIPYRGALHLQTASDELEAQILRGLA